MTRILSSLVALGLCVAAAHALLLHAETFSAAALQGILAAYQAAGQP